MRPKILVVDDQVAIGTHIKAVAEPLGYDVTITTEPRKAMPLVLELEPALIILDIVMPQMDGIEILRARRHALRRAYPDHQRLQRRLSRERREPVQTSRPGACHHHAEALPHRGAPAISRPIGSRQPGLNAAGNRLSIKAGPSLAESAGKS